MTKLAVLIPTHTLNLNDNEKKSLNKIVENYNREHIYFVLPEKIKKIKKPHNLNSVYFEDYFFSNHRNYNKLLLSQMQNLECAPVGITPIDFPVIIKPIINLYGMSNGFKFIKNLKEYNQNKFIGMFWQKYLDGIQYNLDINMSNGKIIQYFCIISEPDNNGMFKYHYYKKNYILSDKIINFIEDLLDTYTGFVNIEVINDYIIEMHLRLNGDLFLYTENNIDSMIKKEQINIQEKYFFPIFIKKGVNINIEVFLDSLNIEYDIDGMFCNNYIRYCYFVCDNLMEGKDLQTKIYKYIKK